MNRVRARAFIYAGSSPESPIETNDMLVEKELHETEKKGHFLS